MPELDYAIKEIESTIAILRDNSIDEWSAELQRLLGEVKATNKFAQKEALFSIGQICHPKALGEVYVTVVNRESWNTQLETLHDACAKAFNILDKQF